MQIFLSNEFTVCVTESKAKEDLSKVATTCEKSLKEKLKCIAEFAHERKSEGLEHICPTCANAGMKEAKMGLTTLLTSLIARR